MAEARADVVLVGGGVASVRCARTLRRNGFEGSILLLAEEEHLPYNRPPLSKELLRDDVPPELIAAEPAAWYARRNVEVRLGATVASIERDPGSVVLTDGSRIGYGQLLLATGAEPRRLPIPGGEAASSLRTVDDAVALRAATRPGAHAVVIGGGFIGVEVAASLAATGVRVTVIEASERLWGGSLGDELSAWAADALVTMGVSVLLGTTASEVSGGTVVTGHRRLRADVVLAAIGVTPRDELAAAAGLARDDGIVTDAEHRTADVRIYAAGDVARVAGRRVEHWHAAREGGERAGLAMLGAPTPPPRAPWIYSDFGDRHLDVVGHASPTDRREVLGDPGAGGGLVAWLDSEDRVVQLAATDGALEAERARALVESRATIDDVREAATPA